MIPTLETDRLHLRPWRAHDFEPMAAFYADERTARYIGGTIGREQAWRRLAAIVGHWSLVGGRKEGRRQVCRLLRPLVSRGLSGDRGLLGTLLRQSTTWLRHRGCGKSSKLGLQQWTETASELHCAVE
jgi:hypothetical protein